jgi:D-glycero-D-manno-heptose 1,7-bisphosphate phosphatase
MSSVQGKKTVFLDRDGTLIIDKIYLNDPDQIVYLPGVFEALARLRDAGYQFIMVTNQSGVARGIVTLENLNEIHRRIRVAFAEHGIEFRAIYYAPYAVDSNHPLRKPSPGMLLKGAEECEADLKSSWMIGDRLSDVVAGHRAGCRSILLTGVESPAPSAPAEAQPEFVVDTLLEATDKILSVS